MKKPRHFTWLFLMLATLPFIPFLNFIIFGIAWLIDIDKCKQYNKEKPVNDLVEQIEDLNEKLDKVLNRS